MKDILKIQLKRRQGGRVEGLELTSSHKNTKITTNCWTTTDKKEWNLPKKIFYIQRQEAIMRQYEEGFCDIIKSHTHQVGDPQTEK